MRYQKRLVLQTRDLQGARYESHANTLRRHRRLSLWAILRGIDEIIRFPPLFVDLHHLCNRESYHQRYTRTSTSCFWCGFTTCIILSTVAAIGVLVNRPQHHDVKGTGPSTSPICISCLQCFPRVVQCQSVSEARYARSNSDALEQDDTVAACIAYYMRWAFLFVWLPFERTPMMRSSEHLINCPFQLGAWCMVTKLSIEEYRYQLG